jgi:very-short-patch-repair endonuclease
MYKCKYCSIDFINTGSMVRHQVSCKRINEFKNELINEYKNGESLGKLSRKYSIGSKTCKVILTTAGVFRDSSAAAKLAHKNNPDAYKHSDESKAKLRAKRLAWMKANPERTAWRTRNVPSYPEKLFMQICNENNLYAKYDIIREYSVFPYYVDFAFLNVKVAVEIDGSQHWLDSDRIERDKLKAECLNMNGWRLIRIPEFKLKQSYNIVVDDLLTFLSNGDINVKVYSNDIIEYESVRQNIRKEKERKTEIKRKLAEDKRNIILNYRKGDFDKLYPSVGWSVKLGDLWGISSQKAAAYSRKYFDIDTDHARITKDQITECFVSKMSMRSIGKKFGLDPKSVSNYCRKYGISIPKPVYKIDWDSIDLPVLLETHNMSEVARQLGVTPSAIKRRIKKNGLLVC